MRRLQTNVLTWKIRKECSVRIWKRGAINFQQGASTGHLSIDIIEADENFLTDLY